MAIKFTAKDQPAAAPAAGPKVAKTVGGDAPPAPTDAAPDGADLFDPEPKAPATKRKPNGFRR
jgi:hypothetical protein